jgi:alkylhydroperoxidase family enzyme
MTYTEEQACTALPINENSFNSHTAAAFAKGMTMAQYQELLAVVALAHQTNALVTGLQVPTDPQFQVGAKDQR